MLKFVKRRKIKIKIFFNNLEGLYYRIKEIFCKDSGQKNSLQNNK